MPTWATPLARRTAPTRSRRHAELLTLTRPMLGEGVRLLRPRALLRRRLAALPLLRQQPVPTTPPRRTLSITGTAPPRSPSVSLLICSDDWRRTMHSSPTRLLAWRASLHIVKTQPSCVMATILLLVSTFSQYLLHSPTLPLSISSTDAVDRPQRH